MQRRILKHITNHNILSTEQYGFRLGLRTDNATYKLTTEILNAVNNKLLVGGIFCDLEKAFDCVNHDILLYKLKFYGISDKALQLYQSYLGNRYFRTAIYRVSQEECGRLREGVPYVKVYQYNPKHLCPKLNGYGDNGQRKVWSSGRSTHCTCQLTILSMSILECGVILWQFSSRSL